MIKFVSDLRDVAGFLWVFRFPPPIKLNYNKLIRKYVYYFVVPSDNEGIIPEALETAMQQNLQLESTTKTPFNAMVYLMTIFSNPKGFSCSPGRCLFNMV